MHAQREPLNERVRDVTERVRARSAESRAAYLARVEAALAGGPARERLSCTNLAHGFAAAQGDKEVLKRLRAPNIAIVSAYNDMLSAHQPFERFPALIKLAAREAGAVAQFAGGVPAMCDGVTQGYPGMELSLWSRDVIAMSTAVALAHNMFDAALCLGICDKIVPGLLMGALAFGHLPVIFVPGGPMPSGVPNKEKARIRQLFAEGKVGRDALLESEAQSYHSPGTCTFYGTANSNQMLMEVMGLHLPGAAFVPPNTPLRDAQTRAAGLAITWDDFSDLSDVVPLLARIYPNGGADVNHFHAAGGMGFLVPELLTAGLLHADVTTVMGQGLAAYTEEPWLSEGGLAWRPAPRLSEDLDVLRPVSQPFSADGGLKLLRGNLGRAVIKTSAVAAAHRVVEAPALVFDHQDDVMTAYKMGQLARDLVAVVRFQGPRANGMPELHKLTPLFTSLQDQGFHVALVTDGRMSGASGAVPAAIHVTPECVGGGPLGRVRDGDVVRLDSYAGVLEACVPQDAWGRREISVPDLTPHTWGVGRELFASFRATAAGAEQGAMACMP